MQQPLGDLPGDLLNEALVDPGDGLMPSRGEEFSGAADLIYRSRDDPEVFFKEILGWTPWAKQTEIARAVAEAVREGVRHARGIPGFPADSRARVLTGPGQDP